MRYLILAMALTGCATPDGKTFIPVLDPVPGYQSRGAWVPMAMPGQVTYIVNGNAYVVSRSK